MHLESRKFFSPLLSFLLSSFSAMIRLLYPVYACTCEDLRKKDKKKSNVSFFLCPSLRFWSVISGHVVGRFIVFFFPSRSKRTLPSLAKDFFLKKRGKEE
jgi:hypothetical protein